MGGKIFSSFLNFENELRDSRHRWYVLLQPQRKWIDGRTVEVECNKWSETRKGLAYILTHLKPLYRNGYKINP